MWLFLCLAPLTKTYYVVTNLSWNGPFHAMTAHEVNLHAHVQKHAAKQWRVRGHYVYYLADIFPTVLQHNDGRMES